MGVELSDKDVLDVLDGLPEEMRVALRKKCSALAGQLTTKIKGKLTFDVLDVVTGDLRRSISSKVTVGEKDFAIEVTSKGVDYAARQEFGFDAMEQVSGHMREINMVFGRQLKEAIMVQVKPFSRQAHTPERSYMRSAMTEYAPEMMRQLNETIDKVAGGE